MSGTLPTKFVAVVVAIEAMRVVLLTLQPTVLLQTYVPMQKQTPVTIQPRGVAHLEVQMS